MSVLNETTNFSYERMDAIVLELTHVRIYIENLEEARWEHKTLINRLEDKMEKNDKHLHERINGLERRVNILEDGRGSVEEALLRLDQSKKK